MNTAKDYYATLGVLPSIDPSALAAVYRALVKKFHPDVYRGPIAESEAAIRELNEAYEVLAVIMHCCPADPDVAESLESDAGGSFCSSNDSNRQRHRRTMRVRHLMSAS